jgi:serine protease inhibitor
MKTSLIAVLAAAFLMAGCELFEAKDDPELRELSAGEKQLVESGSRFGVKLFRQVNAEAADENVFISPLSVSMALGMTLNGAREETRTAMEQALELYGLSQEEINTSYRSLIDLLVEIDPQVVFEIANSIWHRQGFAVEPAFLDVNRRHFDSEVRAEDFSDPATVDRINGWVDEKTRGRIEEIIDQIDADVVMYLINAIYFKGTWQYEFDKSKTSDAPFYALDGSTQTVKLMAAQASFAYAEDDEVQAVDLPYGDGQYRMTVVLPKSGRDVNALVGSLDGAKWDGWTGAMQRRDVLVYLPKFRMERKYEAEMKAALSALGMGIAFEGGRADFRGINPLAELYISRVIHKTFVEVDEEGTEAAAVTAVEVALTSFDPTQQQPVIMRVDRPFVFAIREQHTGVILFVGKVAGF